jgi:hypothetical protein
MPIEKELNHLKNVRIIILVLVTVGAVLAIALVSSTTDEGLVKGIATESDKRGDPGLLFEVEERPLRPVTPKESIFWGFFKATSMENLEQVKTLKFEAFGKNHNGSINFLEAYHDLSGKH